MKTLSVTEVARNFSAVLDGVEREQEEVVLVRNRRQIARLVPEPPALTALEVLGDLYRTLDDGTADALAAGLAKAGRGHGFRVQDLWLAAQAVERKFTLLTANAKDFKDVPGLKFAAVNAPGA